MYSQIHALSQLRVVLALGVDINYNRLINIAMHNKEHQQLVDWIIKTVESRCARTTQEEQRVYAIGFLASYIASKIEQDPYVLKELTRVLNR